MKTPTRAEIDAMVALNRAREREFIGGRVANSLPPHPSTARGPVRLSVEQRAAYATTLRGREGVRLAPRDRDWEFRDTSLTTGTFTVSGYASVYGVPYEIPDPVLGSFMETMRGPSPFGKSLREATTGARAITFKAMHGGIPFANTRQGLRVFEDGTGLGFEATVRADRPDAQVLRAAIETGNLDEGSFVMSGVRDVWDSGYTNRTVIEAKLHEVSAINAGEAANPATAGLLSVRRRTAPSAQLAARIARNRELEAATLKGIR